MESVVDRQRAERADVAAGAVAGLPGGHVAFTVVTRVVTRDAAGDAFDSGRNDRVSERVEARGDVTLRLVLGLQEVAVVVGGQHRITGPDQPEVVDAAVVRSCGCDRLRLVR